MLAKRNLGQLSEDKMSVSFEDKVSFLCAPESYRERTQVVSLLQTHHAWLFMTERHVYKMKKPFRQGGLDYSSLESRRWLCTEEYRLNRRLAKNTYLGVVPLKVDDNGRLNFDAEGCIVEWLVKIVRLPESQMLLVAASEGRVEPADIQKLMHKLLRFYKNASICHFGSGGYVARLRQKQAKWTQELLRPEFGLPKALANETSELLRSYVDEHARLFEQRERDGHIREGHGDLRPEHVFLIENAEPEIIDCLEFDADLRRLDSAEELAFLAMECRHADLGWLEHACFECYEINFGVAAVPNHLWKYYAALGAMVRAGLSAWRMLDSAGGETWKRRAIDYLHDVRHYITAAHAGC